MIRRIFPVVGLLVATASWLAPARAVDDQNCEDFDSQAAAQQHLRNDATDPDQLDPDNDGVACSVTSYVNTARDTNPVGQVAITTTSAANGTTTSTTAQVLPTTVATTGAFSAPMFGAGILLVGIGLSFKGKRAEGKHYAG
jgi:hypothetical protein